MYFPDSVDPRGPEGEVTTWRSRAHRPGPIPRTPNRPKSVVARGDATEDQVAPVQRLRESERDLEPERQRPVCRQVVAGPRNQANRGTDQDDAGSSKSDSALSLGDVPPAPWRSRADFFHGISHVIFESPREKVVKIALKNALKISASL